MKIGNFSQKYKLSVDTVRYYAEIGLLMPERDGNHFDFGPEDEKDIEFIAELKSYQFPITEISKIMALHRWLNSNDSRFTEILRKEYRQRYQEISEQITELEEISYSLQNKIEGLPDIEVQSKYMGVPLDFLGYMRCPVCGREFLLNNTVIEHGKISSADATCDCGFKINIRNGIVYMPNEGTEDSNGVVEKFPYWSNGYIGMNITPLDSIGYKRINAGMRCFSNMYSWLSKSKVFVKERPLLLTSENNCGRFISFYLADNANCGEFLSKAIIIMYMSSEERLLASKKLIESLGIDINIVFILGNSYTLPVKPKSIDAYLDDYSSFYYFGRNGKFILDDIKRQPYLKDDFETFGIINDDFEKLLHTNKTKITSEIASRIISKKESENLRVRYTNASNKYDKSEYNGHFVSYHYINEVIDK